MYIAGRVRTCSIPSSTLIIPSVYWLLGSVAGVCSVTFSSGISSYSLDVEHAPRRPSERRETDHELSQKVSMNTTSREAERPSFRGAKQAANSLRFLRVRAYDESVKR